MTELQLGLIGLGATAVVGVFGYNKWQEYRQRKLAEAVLKPHHEDVLLGDSAATARRRRRRSSAANRKSASSQPGGRESVSSRSSSTRIRRCRTTCLPAGPKIEPPRQPVSRAPEVIHGRPRKRGAACDFAVEEDHRRLVPVPASCPPNCSIRGSNSLSPWNWSNRSPCMQILHSQRSTVLFASTSRCIGSATTNVPASGSA
jgi:hypothetical protein